MKYIYENIIDNIENNGNRDQEIKDIDFLYLKIVAFNRRIRKYLPFMPTVTQYKGYIDTISLYLRYIFNPLDLYNKIISKIK